MKISKQAVIGLGAGVVIFVFSLLNPSARQSAADADTVFTDAAACQAAIGDSCDADFAEAFRVYAQLGRGYASEAACRQASVACEKRAKGDYLPVPVGVRFVRYRVGTKPEAVYRTPDGAYRDSQGYPV